MKKVGLVVADSNGKYVLPAVKGGAVTILVDHLIKENSCKKEIFFEIFSFYDKKAFEESKKYKNVNFNWVKIPAIISLMDAIFYKFMSIFFKRKKILSYKSIFSLLFFIIVVSIKLKEKNIDKLIFENNIPMAWIIKLSGYKGDFYYHFHNVPRISAKCKKIFQKCKGYLCVSDFVAEQITGDESKIGKISKKKVKTLYNCIDTEKFHILNKNNKKIMEYKRKFGILDNDKVIIYVGRISKEKGILEVIKSFDFLENKNIKLLIVGGVLHNSKEKDYFQIELEKKCKIHKNKIIWTGYIPQEELIYLYNLAEIAVLPSIWEEPAGLTMVESLACGTILITTNSGGISEYVGNNAIIINNDENISSNIANKIEFILKNILKYNESRTFRSESILKKYNTENYYNNFKSIIESDF